MKTSYSHFITNGSTSFGSFRRGAPAAILSLAQASFRLLLFCSVVAVLPPVHAITIVDTGTPTSSGSVVTSPTLAIAAEFQVVNDSLITDIQGYLNTVRAGNLTVAVYSDGGDIPGAELFSASILLGPPTATPTWQGVSGLAWNLSSGTYWAVFQADATLAFGMPISVAGLGGAPNPLGNEARRLHDVGFFGVDDLDFGVRIFGEESHAAVPEAGSTLVLGAIGLVAVVGLRKMRPGQNVS